MDYHSILIFRRLAWPEFANLYVTVVYPLTAIILFVSSATGATLVSCFKPSSGGVRGW